MKKRVVFIALALTFGTYVLLVLPWLAEQSHGDVIDSVRYECWKRKVCPFTASVVYPGFARDGERERVVLGLTVEQLRERFVDIRGEGTSTLTPRQRRYAEEDFRGADVRGLGDSWWLVVLENGRVVSLQLLKG